jgi:hypothetical protein
LRQCRQTIDRIGHSPRVTVWLVATLA